MKQSIYNCADCETAIPTNGEWIINGNPYCERCEPKHRDERCRWEDRYLGGVCRNLKTHPSTRVNPDGTVIHWEPTCRKCEGCGYERIDAEHPAWDAGNDEYGD